jgi:small-conductance mechanosensitive channel
LAIASDLRFAIDAAFREAGIEIPFLQTDIHLRDLDRIEKLFSSFRDTAGKDGQPGNS